jgi:FK506-binding protein 1
MTVQRQLVQAGNGVDVPKKHDEVSIEYTGKDLSRPARPQSDERSGWLYDDNAPNNKGTQ